MPRNPKTDALEPLVFHKDQVPDNDIPLLLKPTFNNKNDLNIIAKELLASRARMKAEEIAWWDEFVESKRRARKSWEMLKERKGNQIAKDQWAFFHFENYREATPTNSKKDEAQIENEIGKLINRNNNLRKVCVYLSVR